MTEQTFKNPNAEDPYAELPPPVVEELQGFSKAARNLTIALVVALFIPATFLVVK